MRRDPWIAPNSEASIRRARRSPTSTSTPCPRACASSSCRRSSTSSTPSKTTLSCETRTSGFVSRPSPTRNSTSGRRTSARSEAGEAPARSRRSHSATRSSTPGRRTPSASNNALSIGASVHGSFVNHKSLLQASAISFDTPASPIASSYYGASEGSDFAFEATVGATLRFGKQTVGVSIRTPSLHVFGVGSVNRSTSFDDGAAERRSVDDHRERKLRRAFPASHRNRDRLRRLLGTIRNRRLLLSPTRTTRTT